MLRSMGITVRRKTVTPRMAKTWLAKNVENNRHPKSGRVPMLARDMKEGKWQTDTGEMIKFAEDGQLIDGQNRLRAVILADVDVTFDVAYGVPLAAMTVIDSGAARTAADTLKILGSAGHSPLLASIVRWVLMWEQGDLMGGSGPYRPTTPEIYERYQAESKLFDGVTARASDCQKRGLGTGRPAGMAYYLFQKINEQEAHAFFDQYISGADLPGKSPVLALRNKIARSRVDRLTRPEQLALFIRAWNNYRTDTPMDRMMIVRGAIGNSNFPMPK